MKRTILAFEQDDDKEWRVILSCGHKRHLRHDPPRERRPQLHDPQTRDQAIGGLIECGRCAQRALPDGAVGFKSTPVFDQDTVPKGLLKDHSLKPGVWGKLVISEGSILFQEGGLEKRITPTDEWFVLPEVVHNVTLCGPVRFQIEFLRVP